MEEGRARTLPTVLALLAFLPLVALLWWAVTGPRFEPALLDWGELGYSVEDEGTRSLEESAFPLAPDPVLLSQGLAGRQGSLLGPLDPAKTHGDGAYAAVVRGANGTSNLTEAPGLAGLVVAVGDGDFQRCGFDEPVPVTRLDEAAEDLGPDVRAVPDEATGRCEQDGPLLAVPLVRRLVVPLGIWQRLAGQRAESALLPAGLALLHAGARLEVLDEYAASEPALPVYPREVARQALARATPGNPNLGIGPLGFPAYPVLARDDAGLWWVMPVSPDGDATAVSGLARTRADRMRAGDLNPVHVTWLDDPVPGPGLLERRALAVLEEAGEASGDDVEQFRVWLNVPDPEGRWSGHVAHSGRPLYRLTANGGGRVCVDDMHGHRLGCRGEG